MRVLIIHNRYQLAGGEDAVVQQEAGMLRENGHEVDLFEVTNSSITSPAELLRASVSAIYAKSMCRVVLQRAKEFCPAVLHVHNFFPRFSPAVYQIGNVVECAVVQTIHNYRLLCANAQLFRDGCVCRECLGKVLPWPAVFHGCYRDSRAGSAVVGAMTVIHRLLGTWRRDVDRYIVLTEFARDLFVTNSGIPSERIIVKANAVSDPGYSTSRGRYALYVGRLSPEKGIRCLLEAACCSNGLALPLMVAGIGPLEHEVRAAVRPGQIEYLGYVPKAAIRELMRHAAVLLFPSEWYEGFPMVISEAFAAGLPVIASRLGAMEQLIDHGTNGLLFEPGDTVGLRSALARVASDSQLLDRMSRCARDTYLRECAPEKNVRQLVRVYEEAIASRSARSKLAKV